MIRPFLHRLIAVFLRRCSSFKKWKLLRCSAENEIRMGRRCRSKTLQNFSLLFYRKTTSSVVMLYQRWGIFAGKSRRPRRVIRYAHYFSRPLYQCRWRSSLESGRLKCGGWAIGSYRVEENVLGAKRDVASCRRCCSLIYDNHS